MAQMDRLLEIMARLRDPEDGCPWDLAQDFGTISPFTIEEAYEVDEAIAQGDPEAIRDELGDLLFQVVFQARIAEETGLFAFEGVAEAISEKLVRRHPHVFANADTPTTALAQTASWESIKAAERAAKGEAAGEPPDPFAGIPRNLPALARSAKVLGRTMRLDSRADDVGDPRARVDEALRSLEAPGDPALAAEAVGEGLRAWVALARAAGVDPEQALREADDRAMDRVRTGTRDAPKAHQDGKSPIR